jgi:hypothetical protein
MMGVADTTTVYDELHLTTEADGDALRRAIIVERSNNVAVESDDDKIQLVNVV